MSIAKQGVNSYGTLKRLFNFSCFAFVAICLGLTGCSQPLQKNGADIVLLNGKVYTQDQGTTWADAIAIDGKHISYVGDSQQAKAFIGQNTQVIDIEGQLVLPGFIDTHAHPIMAAGAANGLQLDPTKAPRDWLKAVAEFASDNPDRPGLLGFGFLAAAFGPQGPTKELLDEIVSDRPVILIDEGGHGAWVNSKTLELAGINHNTPDPVPGTHYYQRDAEGIPSGWCLEAMTFYPMIAELGLITKNSIASGSEDVFYLFSSFGITTVYDAGFSTFADMAYETLDELVKEDKLTFRLVTSHMIQSPQQVPSAVETLQSYQKRYSSELVQPRVMKIHNDGTKEASTAGLFEAYAGQPDNFGSVLLEGESLQSFVLEVDEAGFDIHIHAIGDRAVDEALDAFEAARAANPKSRNRYSIAHTELVREEDLARFADLGVVAQTTPYWFATDGELENQMLGQARAEKLYRFRKIIDSGAKVSFGSDFPATGDLIGVSPIVNIEMGQTRKGYGQPNMPVTPPINAQLTLEEMIQGYTIDAAYQLNLETELGSIEAGKLADLVVINENLFEMDVYNVHEAKVAMTFMNGERVYKRNWKSYLAEWILGL